MKVAAIGLMCALAIGPARVQQNQEPDPRATASISGRVVDRQSGAPILGVTLRLVSYDVMRVARSAMTDADGRFTFTQLVPGRYELEARADGYLRVNFGNRRSPDRGRPIDLADLEAFAAADFALDATSAITGVVVDEFGEPAPNILVQASEARYIAGRMRMLPVGGQGKLTDDKGQFRVDNLAPGRYYLTALTGAFATSDETGGFAPTYYPGTPEIDSAQPVVVGVATEVRSLQFALVPAPMAVMAGRLVDERGEPVAGGNVWFNPSESKDGMAAITMARTVAGPDGRFSYRNVPPGAYTVQAFGRPVGGGNLGRAPFGWLDVTMNGDDRTDLVVHVVTGAVLTGTIVFEGDAPRPAPNEVRVTPRAVEFRSSPMAGGPPPRVVHDDWTFEVGAMSGLRVLRTDNTSAVWTLKQVTLNGRDVTDTPIDFRNGDVSGIEVILTDSAANLSGTVTDRADAPIDDYTVVIFSTDARHWAFPSRYLQLARPNQTGGFVAPGLPPGEYLVVALPSSETGDWEDPAFLESIRPLAESVALSAGAERAIALRIAR
jgi:protocatechuate 3,4-dioxygenase beta subunit